MMVYRQGPRFLLEREVLAKEVVPRERGRTRLDVRTMRNVSAPFVRSLELGTWVPSVPFRFLKQIAAGRWHDRPGGRSRRRRG
jgi:hypothetical protein